MEALLDDGEVTEVVVEDDGKLGVLVAGVDLADHREEERDLEMDLSSVGAVEDAVELGVFEGEVELIKIVGFAGGDFGGRFEGIFAGDGAANVGRELARGAGKGAGKRDADGAELRGFKRAVVGGESTVEVGGTKIELLEEVGRAGRFVAEHAAKNKDDREEGDAAEEDFDDEGSVGTTGGALSRAVGLGDMIKIFEIIHEIIIA